MDPVAELLGDSAVIEAVRRDLRRLVAGGGGSRRLPAVLIEGETGTGKGLLARVIHRAGPRARGPFVDVNCAAIPETLLESELFGFERGAFTDARRSKPGLFQAAHRGILFLDEVGLLPEPLQAKLLKVLEEQAVRRLGATQSEPVDVWVVSATNADLAGAVRQRAFREDLYHRLAVVRLRLPPLRERGRDVLALAERFLARACAEYGLASRRLAQDAGAALVAYPWPGNVRELGNVMERVALMAEGEVVTADLLGLPVVDAGAARPPSPPPLDEVLAQHLSEALERTGWNISRTAALLGVARNTVRARMARFGLRPGGAGGRPAPAPSARPVVVERPPEAPAPVESIPAPPPGPARVRWERRTATLLRAALVPRTSGEPPDPSRALELIVEKIRTFGGRLEAVGQASVDASFGLEGVAEGPRRAASAALAMVRAVARDPGGPAAAFACTAALHVAPVLVGRVLGHTEIERDERQRAQDRLDEALAGAAPGTVLVTGPSVPFLERRFQLAAAEAGRGARPYRLLGHGGSGFGLWGRLSRFVGREAELAALEERWARARQGSGQIVGVVGEPGVGKSRLLWEFLHGPARTDGLVLEAQAMPLPSPAPYLPVIALLRRYLGLESGEGAPVVRERVGERCRELDPALAGAVPALSALLDAPPADPEWEGLDPARRARRTREAIRQVLLRESRRQPLVLVFEDMHWADPETQAVLESLADGLAGAPVLVLLTFRPEYQHGWGNRSLYTHLTLRPLSAEGTGELLQGLLGADPSLDPLRPRLFAWTEGNPFFLEETVRTLAETEALVGERGAYRLARPVRDIQVPATVEEVLATRMDRLPEEDRLVLQAAAVAGGDVTAPVLAAAAEQPEAAVREALRALTAAEFLYESASLPEPAWSFTHALTREVAYRSLADLRRQALHGRVLAALELLDPAQAEERLEALAHHALQAGAWEPAARHGRAAGRRAAGRSAHRAAVAYFEQALGALGRLPGTPERLAQAVDLRLDLRYALLPLGELRRVVDVLHEAEALAETAGDRRRLGLVSCYLTNYFHLMGSLRLAVERGRRALDIATALGDPELEIVGSAYLAFTCHTLGEYGSAIELARQSVARLVDVPAGERFGMALLPGVYARTGLALALGERGDLAEARRVAREGLALAESAGHAYSRIFAALGTGTVAVRQGAFAEATAALQAAVGLCREADIPVLLATVAVPLATARARAGEPEQALAALEEADRTAQAIGDPVGHWVRTGARAEALCLAGRPAEALPLARRYAEQREALGARGYEAWGRALVGEVASRLGPAAWDEGRQAYRQALALGEPRGMLPLVARCRLGLAELERRAGRPEAAAVEAAAGRNLARRLGMDGWLALAEAESRRGS